MKKRKPDFDIVDIFALLWLVCSLLAWAFDGPLEETFEKAADMFISAGIVWLVGYLFRKGWEKGGEK